MTHQAGKDTALGQQTIFLMTLVMEELVTNVILHSIGDGGTGRILLRVSRRAGSLWLELRDDAPPFDPCSVAPPDVTLGIDERQVGGLGVYLVRTLMDECSYARVGSENVVRLRKALGGRS